MLMRRYAIVQKARDADVFGILVGTLGVGALHPLVYALETQNASSILSAAHQAPPGASGALPQKELYNQCGQA